MTTVRRASMDATLREAERLVRAAGALSVALGDFGLTLPIPSPAAIDQTQVRGVAVLYLASEFEDAGVVPAAEQVMRLARTGGIMADLGAATPLLQTFWLGRNERATAEERQSFFAGLFGHAAGPSPAGQPRNAAFEDLLIDLAEALYKIDERRSGVSWGGVAEQTRVRLAAQRLLESISRSTTGLTVYLASEILDTLKQALAILTHPAMRAAFGGRGLGDTVRTIQQRLRLPMVAGFDLHVRRGQAGMTILSWLSEAVPALYQNAPIVAADHPVVIAAVDWLEASLALTDLPASGAPGPESAYDDGSGWAALAS